MPLLQAQTLENGCKQLSDRIYTRHASKREAADE
jgi:hypothetical protein